MQIKNSRILQLHAAFQILGVIAQAHYLAKFLSQKWEANHHIDALVSWAGKPTPPKIESMLEYGLLLTIAAAVILALFTYTQRNKQCIEVNRAGWAILGTYELVCLFCSFSAAWIFIGALLPVWCYSRNFPPRSVVAERVSLALSFGVIVGGLFVLSVTSWRSDVQILNNYFDLKEYVRMDDGRVIEISEFMRKHLINQYQDLDLCIDATQDVYNACLHLSNTVFRSAEDPFVIFPSGAGISYDWEKENLLIGKPLTDKQLLLIKSLWGVQPSGMQNKINARRSADEEEFIRKNIGLTKNQKYMGAYLDNHSHLYLPLLGITTQEAHGTLSVYGTGLIKTLASLLKITGMSTFNDYYAIYWCAVYAYLLMLALATWRITRNPWAAAITLISAEIFAGFGSMHSIPELNPILHFPDFIFLMAVAYDLRKGTISSAIIRALAIGLTIWWSQAFGLPLLIASIIWNLFEASSKNGIWRKLFVKLGLEMLIAAIAIFVVLQSNQIDIKSFGIDSTLANWRQLIFLISLVGILIWTRFLKSSPTPQPKRHLLDIAGIGAIYAALVNIFVLPDIAAVEETFLIFFVVAPSAIFLTWILDKSANDQIAAPRFISYITYMLILIDVAAIAASYMTIKQVQYDNESHKSFIWNFSGLTATSKVDPEEMQKSVNLIEKYQPKGRLQIISKYDNWFRILTVRPRYFANIDWKVAVTSHEMVNKTATLINQSSIPILFVEYKLWESNVGNAHSDTTSSISAMSQVLRKISQCYTPGEVGGLLQVWHRSCEIK